MTDKTLTVKTVDGTQDLLAKDYGLSAAFYHVEDAEQRTQLLTALTAIVTAIQSVDADLDTQTPILTQIATRLAATLDISAAALPLPMGAATDAKVEAVRALLDRTLPISASALPLPTGAATETKLEAVRTLLANTLAVSIASLPLPTGAANATKQDAILSALTSTTFPISAAALPLPTGASTESTLEEVRQVLAAQLLPTGAATDAKVEAVRALLAGTLVVTASPSTDQDPIFDHTNGAKVAATTTAGALITPPTGAKYIRVSSDADCLIRTDNTNPADDGNSILLIANFPEVIPVVAGVAVKVVAVTGTANVRAVPLKVRS